MCEGEWDGRGDGRKVRVVRKVGFDDACVTRRALSGTLKAKNTRYRFWTGRERKLPAISMYVLIRASKQNPEPQLPEYMGFYIFFLHSQPVPATRAITTTNAPTIIDVPPQI